MADIPSSRMSDIDSSFRMAARLPQHFVGPDAAAAAVPGFPVEVAALPPRSELNHPPYPVRALRPRLPVALGIRSAENLSCDELPVPVHDSAIDQPSRLPPNIVVQPLYRYGVGGEVQVPDYYQYEDLKGMLGDGILTSGSLPDMSAASAASDKHVETVSRGCSSANSSMGEHPGHRLKLMCSFGGKILPRPGDGKLRYAGGETRILSVRRHITYADLVRKMTQLYSQPVSIKYQLPDDDLDALISVSSDEDLENMMEEYDRLEAGEGNPRIRIFLFSPAEYDAIHLNDTAERRSTDLMYVDAINGLSEELSCKQLDSMSGSASNNSTGFKASDAWNASRIPETVPVSVLTSTAFENASSLVHSLPVGIASHNRPVLSRILSAPVSAPSSPPISSQASQIGQFPIPDVSLHISPDHPPIKATGGNSHDTQRGDGTYHEVEGVGSATSSVNSQHDSPYVPLEPKRVLDSPMKTQQETILAHGNTLDQLYRPDRLPTADIGASRVDSDTSLPLPDSIGRMPKAVSHGKLIPLQEQLVELGSPFLAGQNQLPNIIPLPMDLQTFGAQPQLQVPQTHVLQSLEVRREGYQRTDPLQQSAPENMQAQQQALHRQQIVSQVYPPVCMDPMQHVAPERIQPQELPYYRQQIVSQFYPPIGIEQLQQSGLESIPQQPASRYRQQNVSQLYAPVGTSGQEMASLTQAEQSLHQDDALTGQQPSKSVALQTPVNLHRMGPVSVTVSQLPSAPSSYGVAFQGNNLKQGGGLQYLPSPGGFIDLPYSRIAVQANNEQANRELKPSNILLDSRDQRYMEDQIAREQASIPPVNLEKSSQENKVDSLLKKHEVPQSQSYYSDELHRPVIPPYPGVSIYQEGLAHFTDHGMLNKEHLQQHEDEKFGAHLRYNEGVDWSMQTTYNNSEEMMGGWAQKGQTDTKKELASSEIFGKLLTNTPGLHILEPPFVGTVVSDIHSTVENTGNQFDPRGRAGLVPSVVADSSQTTYLPVRFEGDGLPMLAITQPGTNSLDTSSFPSIHANPVSQQMTDDKPAGSLLVPSSNKVPSPVFSKMEEGRWTEDFESDRLSGNGSGRHSIEGAFESSTIFSLDGGLNVPGSGDMIENSEELLGLSVVSKKSSNKSYTDEGASVPPFSDMQTVVPNGTSYPIGLNTWGLGLDGFQTNIPISPSTYTSTAGGLSTTNASFPLIVDAVTASSSLAQAGKDSSHGKMTVSSQENAHTRADVFLDDTGLISAPSVVPFDSVQVSEGLEQQGLFPIFDSDTVQEPESAECEDEDIKGELEHVAKDVAAAVLQPAPTLSIQNWEDTLAHVESVEEVTKESLLIDESLDEVKLHVGEKEVTFQEMKTGSKETDKDGLANKPTTLAFIAEEDAISRGLQTIKNADLEELRELGSGTFGTVYHGKWRGTDVAIKRIKSSCFTGRPSERERLIADFWREAYILGQLHHPNVVAFYGVVRDGPGGTLATVTEYMVNGSLKQFLQKKDRTMDRRKRLSIIMDAAFGMEYLHGKNIVHFDLKCENLLVNMRDPQRPICKVGDLGLSKVKHQTMVSGGVRGTLPWMAPELLNGSSSLVSEKVDVFSFGIVMWELLTGEEPYASMHYGAIIGGIVNNTLRPPVPVNCDPSWRSLMERCWSAEPGERPSFLEIASELRQMASPAAPKVQVQAPTAGSG